MKDEWFFCEDGKILRMQNILCIDVDSSDRNFVILVKDGIRKDVEISDDDYDAFCNRITQ